MILNGKIELSIKDPHWTTYFAECHKADMQYQKAVRTFDRAEKRTQRMREKAWKELQAALGRSTNTDTI